MCASGTSRCRDTSLATTLPSVDTDWMRARLEEYLELDRSCRAAVPAGEYWNQTASMYNDRAIELLPTVARILKALDAPMPKTLLPPDHSAAHTPRYVRQGLGILRDQDEWDARLRPDEPANPTIDAGRLHDWVWRAAGAFWSAGQPAVAVEYGAKSLTAHIQQKAGSSLADRELAAQVFSTNTNGSHPRLWLPGERDTETWRSRQGGLHYLAMGAYAGIRNVVAHSVETGWSEQEALEYLSVLSTVARWAEETELVAAT